MDLTPLHSGAHDSASDLTASDYVIGILVLAALVVVGIMLYKFVQRRRNE